MNIRTLLFYILFPNIFLLCPLVWGQSVLDEYEENDTYDLPEEIFSEQILNISPTKRIYILSDLNNKLASGDYITLLLKKIKVMRALVVKIKDNRIAIKKIKNFNDVLVSKLIPGMSLGVIRGDDSFYQVNKVQKSEGSTEVVESSSESGQASDILSEDELLSGGDFANEFGDDNMAIKSDNILSLGMGSLPSIDNQDNPIRYTHWNGSWSYQLIKNIWGEISLGQHVTREFPSENLDARFTTYAIRFKYTVSAPFYAYIQPYIGYQIIRVSSPDAGIQSSTTSISEDQLALEKALLDKAQKNTVIFGLTILKRLVPGWFLKGEIGTDLLNIGFSFEF